MSECIMTSRSSLTRIFKCATIYKLNILSLTPPIDGIELYQSRHLFVSAPVKT